jgi:Binding-protein-dependent transport system inner membrane component
VEGDAVDEVGVAAELQQLLPRSGVPELGGAVLAGGRDARAVRAQHGIPGRLLVGRDDQHVPHRRQGPMDGIFGLRGHDPIIDRVRGRDRLEREQQAPIRVDVEVADGRRRQLAGGRRPRVGLGGERALLRLDAEECGRAGHAERQHERTGQQQGARARWWPLALALGITSVLGPSLTNAMLAIGVAAIPVFARLVRGQVLATHGLEYVQAARSLGATPVRVVLRHALPNILAEAGLSFLGLGMQPPTPTWGSMLAVARGYLARDPWFALGPGIALCATVLAFNFLGDALRDGLDPRLRSRSATRRRR